MNLLIVLTYAISLSMDAFAVAICKGITLGKAKTSDALKVGAYFGLFQGLMPLIGYFLANSFSEYIEAYDHWIAFGLLFYIGGKMIWESVHDDENNECACNALSFKNMIAMAVATSIDALAVGIAFSCDGMGLMSNGIILGIFASCILISLTTFFLSFCGVKLGKMLENNLQNRAEIAGGIVLILLGVKILIEHLWNISIFSI